MFKTLQNYFLKYPFYLVVRNKTKTPKGGKGRHENTGAWFQQTGKTNSGMRALCYGVAVVLILLKKRFFLELKHEISH